MNTPDIEPRVLPDLRYHARLIPPNLVTHFADYARPYIKRALDTAGEGFEADDLLQFCVTGQLQLWLIVEGPRVIGAATTEILNYPSCRSCHIFTIAGSKFEEWSEYCLLEILEPYAKAQNCVSIHANVRKGFVPKLLQYGFKHKCVTVTKQLT